MGRGNKFFFFLLTFSVPTLSITQKHESKKFKHPRDENDFKMMEHKSKCTILALNTDYILIIPVR